MSFVKVLLAILFFSEELICLVLRIQNMPTPNQKYPNRSENNEMEASLQSEKENLNNLSSALLLGALSLPSAICFLSYII